MDRSSKVPEKRDWLTLCNGHGVSVEDFSAAFCQRCMAPDCTRSISGKSQFEQRVTTWEERLFERPNRMPEQDPRLVQIQAKRFLDIYTGRVPEVGAWNDPRDLVEPPAQIEIVSAPLPVEVPTVAQEPVTQEPAATEAAPSLTEFVPPVTPPPQLLNTPRVAPQMLGGRSPVPPPPVKDPWETKPVVTESADAVKPGARIRFSGV